MSDSNLAKGEGGWRGGREGGGVAGGQKEQKGRAESWELSALTFAEKQRHDESKKEWGGGERVTGTDRQRVKVKTTRGRLVVEGGWEREGHPQ